MSVYYEIDLAIFWFVNITRYCQKLILVCFIYKQIFQSLKHDNYYDNCMYACISQKAILEFGA